MAKIRTGAKLGLAANGAVAAASWWLPMIQSPIMPWIAGVLTLTFLVYAIVLWIKWRGEKSEPDDGHSPTTGVLLTKSHGNRFGTTKLKNYDRPVVLDRSHRNFFRKLFARRKP